MKFINTNWASLCSCVENTSNSTNDEHYCTLPGRNKIMLRLFRLRFLEKIIFCTQYQFHFFAWNPWTKLQCQILHLPSAMARWRSIKEIQNQISISLNRRIPFGMFNFYINDFRFLFINYACERLLALINGLIWCLHSVYLSYHVLYLSKQFEVQSYLYIWVFPRANTIDNTEIR